MVSTHPATAFCYLRLPQLCVLLGLSLIVVANAETAGDHPLCREGHLRIVSPDPVSVEECREVAKLAMAAWQYDLKQMKWRYSTDMERPLTVQLLSAESMKAKHSGALGLARGMDLVFVSTRVLTNPAGNGTLAHEFGHTQSFRAQGGSIAKFPHYFLEGHGMSLGRSYRDHLGLTGHKYDTYMAKLITIIPAKEAESIFTNDESYFLTDGHRDNKKDDRMHAMGIFFVEYLRVRHHGKGIPDAVERMGRVFELIGSGKTYKSAFKQTYGVSVDQLISEILAFMERTESKPEERLRGTTFEGLI